MQASLSINEFINLILTIIYTVRYFHVLDERGFNKHSMDIMLRGETSID